MNIAAEKQLVESMPDLVMSLSRDGTIVSHGGGRSVRHLSPPAASSGKSLESVWPKAAAQAVQLLIRKAIAARAPLESTFTDQGYDFRARVTPEGPDRALCVVRPESAPDLLDNSPSASGTYPRPYPERRDFLRLFQEVVDKQTLSEQPVALIAINLSGVHEIAKIDGRTAETVVSAVLMRLSQECQCVQSCLCAGQLSESLLMFALGTLDRQRIEAFCGELFESIAAPIYVGSEQYELSGTAGVALLGRDANSGKELLNCARMAAGEALRSTAVRARFFSDTMKLNTRSRLDVSGELRAAIAASAIQPSCRGRHNLASGKLVAMVAYPMWIQPLRGEVPPLEFLNVAEVTGQALALSRALLRSLRGELTRLAPDVNASVTFSFGPLRQHLLHADFLADLKAFLEPCPIAAARIEVRIAASVFVLLPPSLCAGIKALGAQIMIEEFGRGSGSLDLMAKAPLSGLQLDRASVNSICTDVISRRVCEAGIVSAKALRILPVAVGVDTEAQRQVLLELGCEVGSGDLFGDTVSVASKVTTQKTRNRRSGDAIR
ncbi:MAG: EAL domain-containing protein [Gammaproteobacteria bacterium]